MIGFKNSIIEDLNIFQVYKNIFLISSFSPSKLFFFEFFPKNQKIEMISKIKNDFLILDCYEFNNKYCILYTNNGILFYNWKKNEIIRKIKLKLKKSDCEQSQLVNKYYLVGICNYSIFVYNFLNDKLYEYPNNEGIFSFFKNNIYKNILYIYDNYFITWNDIYYYIFSVIPKGLHFIKKEKINPNNNEKNMDEDYKENNNYNPNKTSSNNDSDSYYYDESYNESDDNDDNKKQLFSGNDLKNVFGDNIFTDKNKTNIDNSITQNKGLGNFNKQNEDNNGLFNLNNNLDNNFNKFNNDNSKTLFDDKKKSENIFDNSSNKSEGLFHNFNKSTGLFENINNQNSLFGNINNQNEHLFGNSNTQNGELFGNSNTQNGELFGNSNTQNGGLFGNANIQNQSLFGNSNEQKKSLFRNNNNSE